MIRINVKKSKVNLRQHRGPAIDPQRLGPQGLEFLRTIIAYRKADTGAGTYHSGDHDKVKLRSGYMTAFQINLDRLEKKLNNTDNIHPRARQIFREAARNIYYCSLVITHEIRANILEVVEEIGAQPDQAEQTRAISKIIIEKGHEKAALDHLQFIDAEIDNILRLFGLAKDSPI